MTCCGVCSRHVDHDWDPFHAENDPGHYAAHSYRVALRNGLFVDACWSCWFKWPDQHKTWPELGFGRDIGDVLAETTP